MSRQFRVSMRRGEQGTKSATMEVHRRGTYGGQCLMVRVQGNQPVIVDFEFIPDEIEFCNELLARLDEPGDVYRGPIDDALQKLAERIQSIQAKRCPEEAEKRQEKIRRLDNFLRDVKVSAEDSEEANICHGIVRELCK